MYSPANVIKRIKNLNIQGASAIALSIIEVLNNQVEKNISLSPALRQKKFLKLAKSLAYARPTEPLSQNLYTLLVKQFADSKALSPNDITKLIQRTLREYKKKIKKAEGTIISLGSQNIKKYSNIMTHCHSSTVEKILKKTYKVNKHLAVFSGETRPLWQGRIMARELQKSGLRVIQITDSASGFLLSPYSGKELEIDAVIVGADAILPDGSLINKIGTYDIAVSAYVNKIPFYVAASLLKFNPGGQVPIELREPNELWKNKPKQLKILNFAFDRTPNRYIKAYITEQGIISPKNIIKAVDKAYPWLNQ